MKLKIVILKKKPGPLLARYTQDTSIELRKRLEGLSRKATMSSSYNDTKNRFLGEFEQ
jgi:hypothetical protein